MTETTDPESMHDVPADARQILDDVDGALAESMKLVWGTIAVEPVRSAQREDIAYAIGLEPGVEHPSTTPPVTIWGGGQGRREICVRSTTSRTGMRA